jgi:hypothetical protein
MFGRTLVYENVLNKIYRNELLSDKNTVSIFSRVNEIKDSLSGDFLRLGIVLKNKRSYADLSLPQRERTVELSREFSQLFDRFAVEEKRNNLILTDIELRFLLSYSVVDYVRRFPPENLFSILDQRNDKKYIFECILGNSYVIDIYYFRNGDSRSSYKEIVETEIEIAAIESELFFRNHSNKL